MKNEFRALVAEKADQRLGFSDVLPTRCIGDLQGEELCILYGVVVRFTPARKTRGTGATARENYERTIRLTRHTDHLVSVVLTDPTMPSRSDGLSINFFNAAAMLPPVEQVGDILKCSVKVCIDTTTIMPAVPNGYLGQVQRYGSKLQGISPKFSYYVALLTQADAPDLDATDLKIRALLSSWWNSSAEANTFSVPLMPKPARPTLKIADIVTHDIFCDIIAQVIAVYPLAGRSVRILVSDFTSNDRIQKPNSVPESVAYPLELITVLTCYLWDANADEGATLLPGDYVTLKNARIKLGELGLEAALHGDRDFSRKCNVFKLAENDPVVAGIRK
ncbi:hypothetical protein BC832DRAFT_595469 [Gaertneriomyces semiglobifer]|nr:hypothetical protein BC832DRAFT_595469 [Gaertneriomyces semiglobifer]